MSTQSGHTSTQRAERSAPGIDRGASPRIDITAILLLGSMLLLFVLKSATPAQALSTTVVISQIYSSGGEAGALYRNDYLELFNRGSSPVSISGWSIQYASASGPDLFSNFVTPLNASIAPGQYYLIQMPSGGANGAFLPGPNLIGSTVMAPAGGKAALVNTAAGLACNGSTAPCSSGQLAQMIDLVGYGTATFFEGAAAPGPSTTTAVLRATGGCTETDRNDTDLGAAAPNPRNTASPFNVCGTPTSTATSTPTSSSTSSPTSTATNTGTPTATSAADATNTTTSTATSTPTASSTPTSTTIQTNTPSAIPTVTGTPTSTATMTVAPIGTQTPTSTSTIPDMQHAFLPDIHIAGMPDLVGSFTISPASPSLSTGQPVVITVTITNTGTVPASPFWVDLFINPSTPPTAANMRWHDACSLDPCFGIAWAVPISLAPGQSITLTSKPGEFALLHSDWHGFFAPGTTDLYLYVDSWNEGVHTGAVAELSETNNSTSLHGLSVTGGMELSDIPDETRVFPPRGLP